MDDILDHAVGYGRFQRRLLVSAGLCSASDAMEIMLLSFLSLSVRSAFVVNNNNNDDDDDGIGGGLLSAKQTDSLIATVFVGAFCGSLVLGRWGDAHGRKPTFVGTASTVAIFGLLSAFCISYRQLLFCRFCVGFGIGGITIPFDTYSEFLPTINRGTNLVYPSYFWTAGSLLVPIVAQWTLKRSQHDVDDHDNSSDNWRLLCLVCSIPCILAAVVGMYVVPESPRWLLAQHQQQKQQHQRQQRAPSSSSSFCAQQQRHQQDQKQRALEILKQAAATNGNNPDLVFFSSSSLSSSLSHDDDNNQNDTGDNEMQPLNLRQHQQQQQQQQVDCSISSSSSSNGGNNNNNNKDDNGEPTTKRTEISLLGASSSPPPSCPRTPSRRQQTRFSSPSLSSFFTSLEYSYWLCAMWFCYAFLYYGTVLTVTRVFSSPSSSSSSLAAAAPAANTTTTNNNNNNNTSYHYNDDDEYHFQYGAIWITSLAEVAGTTLLLIILEKWGRRLSCTVCFALGGSMAATLCLLFAGNNNSSTSDGAWPVLLAVAFLARMLIFSGSAITWIWTAEMLPTHLRTTGHSVANAAGRVGGFLSPYLVSTPTPSSSSSTTSPSSAATTSSSFSTIGITMIMVSAILIYCSRHLPETKGAPMGRGFAVLDNKNKVGGGGNTINTINNDDDDDDDNNKRQ